MARFDHYIGIDYSGAKAPTSSLKGLRLYMGNRFSAPVEIQPPPSRRKYWTRRGIAEWLVAQLCKKESTIVGIDHGFSFPVQYFNTHRLQYDWPEFLEDFNRHWPVDKDNIKVQSVRDGVCGNGAARRGNGHWKRLTEVRAGSAKSVFHFDVPGEVAKSTHAGLPWLYYLKKRVGTQVHFWPFDGWDIPLGKSAVVEVYPSLWRLNFPCEDRNQDQQDAYVVAEWMRNADLSASLKEFLIPCLTPEENDLAQIEGWILGCK